MPKVLRQVYIGMEFFKMDINTMMEYHIWPSVQYYQLIPSGILLYFHCFI